MKKTESFIQQSCLLWFHNNYTRHGKGLMFSVPNELAMMIRSVLLDLGVNGKIVNNAVSRMIDKVSKTGFTPGASDAITCLPNGKTLFIEFKTPEGRQSDSQLKFQSNLQSCGHIYVVCRSVEEFIDTVSAIA